MAESNVAFTVTAKNGQGAFVASYLVDGNGNLVIDPTWNQAYSRPDGKTVVSEDGQSYTIVDSAGNQLSGWAANPNGYLIAPEGWTAPGAFSEMIYNASTLGWSNQFQNLDLLVGYGIDTRIANIYTSPPEMNTTIQGWVIFGAGNSQLNPTGNEFTNSIIQPFTGAASYAFGVLAADRPDGLALIQQAGVGSHLGVRIWNFDPKKPSKVRISTNYILTLDGSARGLNFKRRGLV